MRLFGAVNVLAPMHRVAAGGWGTIATLRKETDNVIKADGDCDEWVAQMFLG